MAERPDDISKNLQKEAAGFAKEINQAIKSQDKAIEKQLRLLDKAEALRAAGFKTDAKRAQAEAEALDGTIDRLEDVVQLKQQQLDISNKDLSIAKKISEEAAKAAAINKSRAKVFSDIADTLSNIPGIGGLLSDVFENAAKQVEKTGSIAKGLLSVFNSIARVAGPAAILKSLLDISKQTQDISRNLGVGFEAAREIRKEFSQIARDSDDVRINSIDLVKAQGQLITSLGLSVKSSGEVSQNFIRNSEFLGASVEAAGNLERIIAITGGNSTEFTESLALAANESGKIYGINLPLAKVVENIKNLQGETLVSLMRSPEALVKAVALSEKLGIEFGKIKGLAEGLTNFESSITAEIEAEVLLGRELNLNRARALAFAGDYVGLQEEITNQVGSLAEYENMIPVQREAYAKALNMTSDELANILLKQELSNRFGEQARDLSLEQLQAAKQLAADKGLSDGAALRMIQEEVSATKNFEDAAQKIRAAFQDAVVKFAPMIESISKVIGTLAKNPLAQFLAVGAAGLGTISAAAKMFRGLTGIQKVYVVNNAGGGGGASLTDAFGFGTASKRRLIGKFGKGGAKMLMRGARGGVVGLVGGLAGEAIRRNAQDASMAGFGGALEGGATLGGLGFMVGGPIGAAVGGALGATIGGIAGYLDKKEAEREAKRTQVQKEIDERGAVAEELRMLRKVMEEKDTTLEMDSTQVGKVLNKGSAMYKTLYNL